MARPPSHGMTIRRVAGTVKPVGVFWRETDETGRRRRRAKFFDTDAEAQAFKTRHEANAAALAPYLPPPKPSAPRAKAAATLSDPPAVTPATPLQAFGEYFLTYIAIRRKHSTQRMYRNILETHVYGELGALSVGQIDTQHIVTLLAKRAAADVGWGTQKAIIRALSACLRWAVWFKCLKHNPCLQLTKALHDDAAGDYVDPEPNPLSETQAAAFLAWLQTGTIGPVAAKQRGGQRRQAFPQWYPYFLFLILTGARRGEAAPLRWTTVDLGRSLARLERNYSPSMVAAIGGDGETTLKGKRAREIELAPALIEALADLLAARRAAALSSGSKFSPYVFLTESGSPVRSDCSTAARVFERGMAAIGATTEGHTIHDLRDTFATLNLMHDAGRLAWVSWMLGHRQTSTTLNRYTKWIPKWAGGTSRIAGSLPLAAALEAGAKVGRDPGENRFGK